jgi:hypothetical protein
MFYEELLHMQISKAQETDFLTVSFPLLGNGRAKAAQRSPMKSTPGVNFTNSKVKSAKPKCNVV